MAKSKKPKQPTPVVHLTMRCGDAEVYGPGFAKLCMGVREYGSINKAAKSMNNMAYSKAWRMSNETENGLGVELFERDGARGSSLTEKGNQLLDVYREVEAKLQKIAEEEFKRLLG